MTLAELNALPADRARAELHKCCGSAKWAELMATARPFKNVDELKSTGESIWHGLSRNDWLEAFSHHPRIGEKSANSATGWEAKEQSGVATATEAERDALEAGNTEYEHNFGHVFLICATNKSAAFMLDQMLQRMNNTPEAELKIAVGEQAKITNIRLDKLLGAQ